jgi:hypothetical protein
VPPDRDWVDYFLFDSQQGYCDYFATAMTVMLRAEGVPARVASGFAPGDFDQSTGVSTVLENHAHSWVEAYFPRYGWITFEPSSIRALPPRIEDASAAVAPPSDASADTGADASQLTPDELDELLAMGGGAATSAPPARPFLLTLPGMALLGVGVLLGIAVLASGVLALAWRRGLTSLNRFQRPYAELVKLGRWSGALRAQTNDTPFEVAERMGRQVPRAHTAITDVTDAYVEATYAGRPPGDDPRPTWLAARRDVIRGLFGRRLGGWFGEDSSVTLPPRSHPELLRRWGAGKQNQDRQR